MNTNPDDGSTEALVTQIAEALNESNIELLRKVVEVLGPARTAEFFQKTLEIEAAGGLMIRNGSRRRTPGGVFFQTIKDNISGAERHRIFPRPAAAADGTPGASTQAAPATRPPTWEEAKALMVKALQAIAEAKTVKITLIGRPSQVTKQDTCVVLAMKGKPPATLPKGLPTPPANSAITWAVFIVNKQWNRVKDSISNHADDQLIIEGYPMVDAKRGVGVVMATNCKSVYQERAQRAGQQEDTKE
jgi:hypothetical protein